MQHLFIRQSNCPSLLRMRLSMGVPVIAPSSASNGSHKLPWFFGFGTDASVRVGRAYATR